MNKSIVSEPRTWIIIPSFNTVGVMHSCLTDLSSQTYRNIEVIVSDSGSTDGTCDLIRQEFPWVHVVRGNADWWWTKATNEGIKCALSQAGPNDHIMTLNNDVAIPNNYIGEMVKLGEKHGGSIIGSSIYDATDQSRLVECGSYIDWRTMKYHLLSLHDFDEGGFSTKLMFLCGKGVLYPVSVFRKHGLFDETALPHYGADQDFAASCRERGYPLRVQSQVPLYSHENITALGAGDAKSTVEKLKLLFIRKSKLNLPVHLRIMLRHCPKRYWVTSAVFLTCRLLGHIFIKGGVQDGPVAERKFALLDKNSN
jgi:GT2 family glycosyltransferase